MSKLKLEEYLGEMKDRLVQKQLEIDSFALDPDDFIDEYNDLLDGEGPVYVAGYAFSPSDVLSELDTTAYRCGLNDYADSIDKEETLEYKALINDLEEIENEIEDIENEIEEIEDEEE